MGSLWRSAPMQLVQLFVQIEAAHDTVDELATLGVIQFRDLNPELNAFQRNFINEVKRCDEMERKLRYFEDCIMKEAGVRSILSTISVEGAGQFTSNVNVDELEVRFEDLEKELHQMNGNQQMLDRNYNELIEIGHVLAADNRFFADSGLRPELEMRGDVDESTHLLVGQDAGNELAVRSGTLRFLTGVILRDKVAAFERVLWRSTRGNVFLRHSDINQPLRDPASGAELEKKVFICFFHGDRLQMKVKKICESFGATLYLCPEDAKERGEMSKQVSQRISDLEVVLARSRDHRKQMLSTIAVNIQTWKAKIIKEKAIYVTMNMFNYDVGRKCLIAEGWCPETATNEIQLAMRRATQKSGALVPSILSTIPSDDVPPTHFETSKYTRAFQEIVNSYGVAHYREVNPAVFTIVTFPFLFGVMFADVGHGLFLLAFSLILIYNEQKLGKQKLNEVIQMPFDGRYALFLMSLFSIYIGFIYNEFFSIPMDIFGSNWKVPDHDKENLPIEMVPKHVHWTYPFGVDPAWKGAPNELDYYNSFKMKLSILLGVTQMSLGVILSAINAWHERPPLNWLNLLCQFIPQILFLWCIFGYMCSLIIIKWCTDWDTLGQGSPPMILPIIIGMFLSPTKAPDTPHFIRGQHELQVIFLVVALLCIPIMLLIKPFVLRHMAMNAHRYTHLQDEDEENRYASRVIVAGQHKKENSGGHGHGEEFEFAEVMIHQIIHTIEYVLGAISNTASYLRLWALSLAHSELSTVFWNRVLMDTMLGKPEHKWGNPILIIQLFVAFSVWAGATIAVLLIMETLSAFLHALRLHWVEFQNKFYVGDGIRFSPLCYNHILSGNDEE